MTKWNYYFSLTLFVHTYDTKSELQGNFSCSCSWSIWARILSLEQNPPEVTLRCKLLFSDTYVTVTTLLLIKIVTATAWVWLTTNLAWLHWVAGDVCFGLQPWLFPVMAPHRKKFPKFLCMYICTAIWLITEYTAFLQYFNTFVLRAISCLFVKAQTKASFHCCADQKQLIRQGLPMLVCLHKVDVLVVRFAVSKQFFHGQKHKDNFFLSQKLQRLCSAYLAHLQTSLCLISQFVWDLMTAFGHKGDRSWSCLVQISASSCILFGLYREYKWRV